MYGAVNFINSDNYISDTIFIKSHSEDFVNFINSKTELENIELINTASDAIDVDDGKLKFTNLKCKVYGKYSNTVLIEFPSTKIAENIAGKWVRDGMMTAMKVRGIANPS